MTEFSNTDKEEKQRKKDDRRRIRELSDLSKILNCVEGRRLIWRILSEAGLYKNCFTGNSQSFFLQGKQAVAQWLLSEVMSAQRTAFANMQQEFYSERTSEEIQKQKEDSNNKEIIS